MRQISHAGRAVGAIAAPLLWSNRLLPGLELGIRGRTVVNALAATGYASVFAGSPNWYRARGLSYGLGGAGVVAAGYAAAVAIPPIRRVLRGFGGREPEVGTVEWVAVHIPLGTVYSEELIFRGTLDPLLDDILGTRLGSIAGAAAFGLWHIHSAHASADNVAASVAFTAAAGVLFGGLRRHTDSATAPALVHWAVNAGGALAAALLARIESAPDPDTEPA